MVENEGGFLLSQIKRIGSRIFEQMLKDAGIEAFNGAQGRILYVLWQEDDLPIVEVSRRTGLAKTTLTSMLDRMEQKGHLVRLPDPHDRRQIRLRLTEETRELRPQYERISNAVNEFYYEDFSDEEILQFQSYLKRILQNLQKKEGEK